MSWLMIFLVLALCVGGIKGGEVSVHHFASCRVPEGSGNSDIYDVAKRGRPDNRMRSACVARRLGDFGYALRHNETLSMVSETLSSEVSHHKEAENASP